MDIKYINVTGCQQYQIIDSDYLTKIGIYEIKNSYKDNKILCIEDYTNINESLAPISLGWFYKTKADLIVFVSQLTRAMVFLPLNDKFKEHYENIKENYKLNENWISQNSGRKWQSAYRKVPFDALKGYIAVYKCLK